MDITVYLPDEIGERAKAAELNLSRLLRDAVTVELDRRETLAATLAGEPDTFEVALETKDGVPYTGRITGTIIGRDSNSNGFVFLTPDERILLWDEKHRDLHEIKEPEGELRDWLADDAYIETLAALGISAVVDV